MTLENEIRGHLPPASMFILRHMQDPRSLFRRREAEPDPFAFRFKVIISFLRGYGALNEDSQERITAAHCPASRRKHLCWKENLAHFPKQQLLNYCVCHAYMCTV